MAHLLRSPSLRRSALGGWMCAVLAAILAAGACSDSGGFSTIETPPQEGEEDQLSNGLITVDEASMSAVVVGGELRLDVPVRTGASAASGSLNVSVRSVDGVTVRQTVQVSYDIAAATSMLLRATLTVPDDVALQPDWVRYNVRVDDGDADGLRVTSSLLRVVQPYEVRLEGPATVTKDKQVSYRVRAQNPITQSPIEGIEVELVVGTEAQGPTSYKQVTGVTGDAVFELGLPVIGTYTVQAQTGSQGTTAQVEESMTVVEPDRRVLLTTDKPIYQPGQTIYLRALALNPPENTPVAGEAVIFEVEDGRGNKIFKKELSSDEYGIAASKFNIGRIVNEGTFKVRVSVGGSITEKTVNVSRYALPKFDVDVAVQRPWYSPGETVAGSVDAGYFFGQPVADAEITVEAFTLDIGETVFQRVVGRADASGHMAFVVSLPASLVGLPLEQGNAVVGLRFIVTDTAGQQVTKETSVAVAERPLRVAVVPESTTLVPGVENRLQVFASDPLGEPTANAAVLVSMPDGTSLSGVTDGYGYAEMRWMPPKGTDAQQTVQVTVTPVAGGAVTEAYTFGNQAGGANVLVRTDQSVYSVGDTVTVELLASEGETLAYVDWLNEGQAVDMRTVDLAAGAATFSVPVDSTLLGSNRVEAYVVDDEGAIARAGRTVFVRSDATLNVTMTADKTTYAPGETASLTFSVADSTGAGVPAALGVQVVDEAVFSLVDARPGLLETYFQLNDEFATPQYELAGPLVSLTDVLFRDSRAQQIEDAQAAQKKAEGVFAALGGSSVTGIQSASWGRVVQAAKMQLDPYYVAAKQRIVDAVKLLAEQQIALLGNEGCNTTDYYCEAAQKSFSEALGERVRAEFRAADFWGNFFKSNPTPGWQNILELTSNGPDERETTADDSTLSVSFADVELDTVLNGGPQFGGDLGGPVFAPGAPNAGGGAAGATAGPPPEPGREETGAPEPRVRRDFPETLYVNPAVITGADGTATIQVPLADSITEWRVTTLANSAQGQLGGGESGVTVFQDFFVDVNFPATMTRGDEVEFPVVVYNYLQSPQNVRLELEAASWYTPLGVTAMDVALEPGQVVGVSVPVRVEQVGRQALTVRAYGAGVSDAVARTVQVVPDGRRYDETFSGSIAPGSVTHTATFPIGAVVGSENLYLNVYPAFLSQVVEGMDSMLQVPSGCFEQTTSTTWPNVLVTRYMEETGQITPDIQLRAESLISAGYQRLLTFEHPGGGFSWFGAQDPAPYLSVTAFGIMEFVDMAAVHTVDQAMVDRTRTWLVAQQQADGSWAGDMSEFFSFHTSGVRNTAFVVWALASAGYSGAEVTRGLDYIRTQLGSGEDAYTLGLVANAFVSAAPNDPMTTQVLADLDAMKQVDGDKISWSSGGTQTNFYGSGDDAGTSATAIVAHALLLDGGYAANVQGALNYLVAQKDANGNFGSTQATVWTLRTLVLAATRGTESALGTVTVNVDGALFTTLNLTASQSDVMTTVDLSNYASTGAHDVSLTFAGTGRPSYNLVATHHLPWASVPPEPLGPLSIDVAYDKTLLRVNETARATVTVQNNTSSTQNMVLITVGVPPGFSVATEDLDGYKASGVLSHYEVMPAQVTLYVSELAPSSTSAFSYRLTATMPVRVADGGAEAYLYYEPEQRVVAEAQTVEAQP